MNKDKLDALLISSVPNIIYLTNYAGFSSLERDAYLLVTKKNVYLFTSALYAHEVRLIPANFLIKEISVSSPLPKQLSEIVKKENISSVGIENDNLTIKEYELIKPCFNVVKHVNLQNLRIVKTQEEIGRIKKACEIGDSAFRVVKKIIKSKMTEKAIALKLELYIREHGAEIAFPPIVAFGKNSAIPHHKTDETKLKTNDVILIDFGVKLDNYCSDMTRTFFIGKPTAEQKKAYDIVLTAQKKAIQLINTTLANKTHASKPTITAATLDKVARDYIISQGYNIPHSIGHGIGLEVHEAPAISPTSSDHIEEGMVFSIEPGIYVTNDFGVRVEDLFAITHGNLTQLTHASVKI